MYIRIGTIKKNFKKKLKDKDKQKEQRAEEINPLRVYNMLPASLKLRELKPGERYDPRDLDWPKDRELPENIHPELDKICFELEGYRYDRETEQLIIYTSFEYRLYCPCGELEYMRFSEDASAAEAHDTVLDCKMLAYYTDPDFQTLRSLNPMLNIIFRWFFH